MNCNKHNPLKFKIMKNFYTLLVALSFLLFQSCTIEDNTEYIDNDTISEAFEITTSFNTANGFSKLVSLNPAIFNSDVVLVYRLSGVTTQGNDIWKLLPEMYFYNDGTLDFGYKFDFTKNDVRIFMFGNELETVVSDYKTNQVFRIVIVPAYFSNTIDIANIDNVLSALKINKAEIQLLK